MARWQQPMAVQSGSHQRRPEQMWQRYAAKADAILTSTKTVIDDNPTLDSKGTGKNPYRIVMGTSDD
jgi:riboflavin biosynthesis pyrimidine reductase